MSRYKKDHQRVTRQLSELKRDSPGDTRQLDVLDAELRLLESDELRRREAKYGLDLTQAPGVGPWTSDAINPKRMWLEQWRPTPVRKVIEEARFAYYKRSIDTLTPIASVLIALASAVISLLAVTLAAIALYLQLVGMISIGH